MKKEYDISKLKKANPKYMKHIKEAHPEIKIPLIRETLIAPDEVRKSTKHSDSELYYLLRKKNRFTCVVVKICPDENYISTALTTSKPKAGIVVYQKGNK